MFIESAGDISFHLWVFGYWCGDFNLILYLVSRHKWNEHLLLKKKFTSLINLDNEEKKKKNESGCRLYKVSYLFGFHLVECA